MVIYSPRVWWLTIALLLWTQHAHSREITHEDIRDAMLSLVHMVRISEDKLERHELRERALGEHVKKMLSNLDKKHRALEPLKGMISRLDERLSNVETIYLQKEEREKSSQNKINEALDSIQKTLAKFIPKPKTTEEVKNDFFIQNNLQKRLDATDAKIDLVTNEIRNLKSNLNPESLRGLCLQAASDMNPFEKHISEAEKLLNKYELKLSEYNVNNSVQTDFVPLNEVAAADEAWHNKMSEVMERQEKDISKIHHLLSDAESMWKDLPRVADLNRSTKQIVNAVSNSTEIFILNNGLVMQRQDAVINKIQHISQDKGMCKDMPRLADLHHSTNHIAQAISNATETLVLNSGLASTEVTCKDMPTLTDLHRSTNQIMQTIANATETQILNSGLDASNFLSKLRAMGDRLAATNEDIQSSLTEGNTMTERAYNNISRSFDMLRTEVQLLSQNDLQIQEISDNVLAIKKRLGIVVSQVIVELRKDIQGIHNKIITSEGLRLDSMEKAITDNQTKALINISSTLDSEMSRVWRQIGFTFQKITKTQNSLDKLTDLSEQYVNRSSTDMNTVKTDVSDIKSRMVKFEEDMNYALGQLSVKSREFERQTSGIVKLLNNLPQNITTAPIATDGDPGPHKIASEETVE